VMERYLLQEEGVNRAKANHMVGGTHASGVKTRARGKGAYLEGAKGR